MDYFKGVQFITYGDDRKCAGFVSDRLFDGYYGIQYTHAGRIRLRINEEPPVILNGPAAFLSAPGARFHYGPLPGESRHHVFVCFSGERVDSYLASGLLKVVPFGETIAIVHSERFYAAMTQLHKLLDSGTRKHDRAVLQLEDLLLQLHEQPPAERHVNCHQEKALLLLSEEIRRKPQRAWDFEQQARKMSVSYSHFRRIFRERHGESPGKFLLECRLLRASELLLHSEEQIRLIAGLCGFQDEFYFSRWFKKHRMLSPLRYRKEFK